MRLAFIAILFSFVAVAQQPKGPPPPPLVACGTQSDGVEILCGVKSPEDIEITPDGKFLITTQMVRTGHAGVALFDIAKKTFTEMTVAAEPDKAWGDPACPGPIGDQLVSHGSSLAKRANGAWQYFVTNHGGRQSVEMFELRQQGSGKAAHWLLAWHGCVTTEKEYNDVAALADGGYVATHPTALQVPGQQSNLFDGHPSGWVSRWTPGKGEMELPGTRWGYPNGILASPDGRNIYYAAWTAKEIHRYSMPAGKDETVAKLDFMPDNITWTGGKAEWNPKAQLLAAGVKSTGNTCGELPCTYHFGVAQLNPVDLKVLKNYASPDKALISGVSVAFEVGKSIYLGAFQGDRLVKLEWK